MENNTKRKENGLINIGFNILIPSLLLIKGHSWFGLSPTLCLSLALVFPVGYGLYDFLIKRKVNFISAIGFFSILITGGIGLLKLPKEWIAIKEATIPLVIGLAILISQKTRYPLIRTIVYNDTIMDIEKVENALKINGNRNAFEKLLSRCTFLVSGSFLLSSILNFTLAKILIKSPTGTQAFTEELGTMTAWSYPVIAIPCTVVMIGALLYLFQGIKKLTGLEFEEVLNSKNF